MAVRPSTFCLAHTFPTSQNTGRNTVQLGMLHLREVTGIEPAVRDVGLCGRYAGEALEVGARCWFGLAVALAEYGG